MCIRALSRESHPPVLGGAYSTLLQEKGDVRGVNNEGSDSPIAQYVIVNYNPIIKFRFIIYYPL